MDPFAHSAEIRIAGMDAEVRQRRYTPSTDESVWEQPQVYFSEWIIDSLRFRSSVAYRMATFMCRSNNSMPLMIS